MPNVDYEYRALSNLFPGVAVGTTSCVAAPFNGLIAAGTPQNAQWPWLIIAATLIGRYPGPAWADNAELQWRIATLDAAACVDGMGNLAATPLIGAVDPTEQGVLTYSMASVMTAWLSMVVTQNLNFMHLTRYVGVINFNNALRPDFISEAAPNTYQIWESKGRVGGGAPAPMRDGFLQTLSVASLDPGTGPIVPNAYVCCLCRLSPAGTWDLKVTDPSALTANPMDQAFRGKLYAEYYRPFKGMIDSMPAQTASFANATFAVAAVPGLDATLGIDQRIAGWLDQYLRQQISPAQLADSIDSVVAAGYPSQSDPTRAVNRNGIYSLAGDSWFKS